MFPASTTTHNEVATCPLLGSELAILDYPGAVALVRQRALRAKGAYAVAMANTHVVTLGRHDRGFGRALQEFDLLLPDGMPLVWWMNRRCRAGLRDRVYGPTFMLRTMEATQGEFRHFLLGGSDELLGALQTRLKEKFPALQICGTHAPPFGTWTEEEDLRIIALLRAADPHFVWVGLGCPKQETWIARNKERLPPAIHVAVGAAFAFHAGRVRQAPGWMQDAGLEWLFRLAVEPRRLWRRYAIFNFLFLVYLAAEAAGRAIPRR